jgi:acetoin utilization protein AcuB
MRSRALADASIERVPRLFAAIGGLMAIEHIMSRQVVTVQLDDNLKQVRDLFAAFRFHHLLVLEHGKLVGIISDRDLLANLSPFIGKLQEKPIDLASLQKHVHQIMSRHVVTVTPSTSLQDAAKLMLDRGISCLPVVNAEEHVVGIVTWRDLLRGAYGIEPAKTAA